MFGRDVLGWTSRRGGVLLSALSLAAVFVVFSGWAGAAIIYVDDSAPAGGDGSSWSVAHRSLKVGLQQASAGDEIRVARGTYRPAGAGGKRTKTFTVPDGIVVQGGYAGWGASNPDKLKPNKFKTILSGDLNGNDGPDFANSNDNSYHVVTLNNVSGATQLRGLTIRGGNANASDSDSPHGHGGGIRCIGGASATLIKCIVRDNQAMWTGGGVSAPGGSVTMTSCTVRDNLGILNSSAGAGVYCASGNFEDCKFLNNHGGIAYTGGGGISGISVAVNDCTFKSNWSAAISCGSHSVIRGCDFRANAAEDGGALYLYGDNIGVIDCLFEGNGAASFGGAVYNTPSASSRLLNCQFFDNGASSGHAVANRGVLTAVNCLFSGNAQTYRPAAEDCRRRPGYRCV